METTVALNNSLVVKFREVNNYESFIVKDGDTIRDMFSQTWNKIAFNCGLRNKLTEFELVEIFKFVNSYFQSLTLEDVEKAFGLYSANRLTFMVNGKQQTTVGHFQSFDNVFIGGVLKAYNDYSESKNQIKNISHEETKELSYNDIDGKEAYEFIENAYKEKPTGPWTANWNMAFRYMENNKILDLSNDEKQMFMDLVIADIQDEIESLRNRRKSFSYEENMLDDKKKLKAECRKRMIKKYFETKS